MSRPRALITGATGFIGSYLVHGLMGRDWDVHCLVRTGSDTSQLTANGASVHIHDGSTEQAITILDRSMPDVVFHLASMVRVTHQPEDIDDLIVSNVLFGTQLLEAMRLGGHTKLVNVGSGFQHYESSGYRPVCLYAATKQAFQDICLYYADAHDLSVLTLIINDTYGPNDPRPKVVPLLMRAALSGEALPMTLGEQELDLLHVDDVVSGLVRAGELLLAGTVTGVATFGLTSRGPVTVRELVDAVRRVTGRPLRVNLGAVPYRPREVMVAWRGEAVLPDWVPTVDLDAGLRATWESMSATSGDSVD